MTKQRIEPILVVPTAVANIYEVPRSYGNITLDHPITRCKYGHLGWHSKRKLTDGQLLYAQFLRRTMRDADLAAKFGVSINVLRWNLGTRHATGAWRTHELTTREQQIIELWKGNPSKTLQEIGNLVGLTRERVRQIVALRLRETGRGRIYNRRARIPIKITPTQEAKDFFLECRKRGLKVSFFPQISAKRRSLENGRLKIEGHICQVRRASRFLAHRLGIKIRQQNYVVCRKPRKQADFYIFRTPYESWIIFPQARVPNGITTFALSPDGGKWGAFGSNSARHDYHYFVNAFHLLSRGASLGVSEIAADRA